MLSVTGSLLQRKHESWEERKWALLLLDVASLA